MIVRYVNHNGTEVNLNKEPYKMLVSDLLDYEWEVSTTSNRIVGFGYTVKEKALNIDVHRSRSSGARENMNTLTEIFEKDILSGIPGRLYINEQYMTCYIKSSEKDNWETDQIIQCEYGIVTDFPFWIKEKILSYPIYNGDGGNEFLEYPYDYAYDYTSLQKGLSALNNDHYADANFKLTIYGPVVNPVINIGGYPYEVNTTVEANEYLVIDSTKNAVTRTLTDGTIVNEYNNRSFENSVFRPIPPGNHSVLWSGDFGWDIILYQERSEPKW